MKSLLFHLLAALSFSSPVSAESIPANLETKDSTFDWKVLLYHERGCFLQWLDGDYLKSISSCDKAINYVPKAEQKRVVLSFEGRAMSKQALGDLKGACDDWEMAIKLGHTPMPTYWSTFAKSFRKKKPILGHSKAYEEVTNQYPFHTFDQEEELKQVKMFCMIDD